MGRNLNQIIAALPPERQERIDARYQELKQEVDGLRELRQIAGKAQADIATALNIKQPSVSKIEKQADMPSTQVKVKVEPIVPAQALPAMTPAVTPATAPAATPVVTPAMSPAADPSAPKAAPI